MGTAIFAIIWEMEESNAPLGTTNTPEDDALEKRHVINKVWTDQETLKAAIEVASAYEKHFRGIFTKDAIPRGEEDAPTLLKIKTAIHVYAKDSGYQLIIDLKQLSDNVREQYEKKIETVLTAAVSKPTKGGGRYESKILTEDELGQLYTKINAAF